MITLIEALNYRCLRYISQPLRPFQVLVGPNASGKSTFIDVIAFMSDLVKEGLTEALRNRTDYFNDLVWNRVGNGFELAIEVAIPDDIRKRLNNPDYCSIRYEIGISMDKTGEPPCISHEKVIKKKSLKSITDREYGLFPDIGSPPDTILHSHTKVPGEKISIYKQQDGNDHFYAEGSKRIGGKSKYNPSFRFGPYKAALASVPVDEDLFPASNWLRDFLLGRINSIELNSQEMKKPSVPGQPKWLIRDGSNIPWLIETLKGENIDTFNKWLEHIKQAIPDIQDIEVNEDVHNRARYITIEHISGSCIHSWMLSDGTLKLLALTLIAYLSDTRRLYMIEEPENGVHPKALQTMLDSLRSLYDGQVLIATHSPLLVRLLEPQELLCFAKVKNGATDVRSGDKHPLLKDRQQEANLGVFFASGVLG